MTLKEASQKYPTVAVADLINSRQQDAFAYCLSFLQGVSKTKGPNRRYYSGTLKHRLEKSYHDRIDERTFILAALASDFTPTRLANGSQTMFNISERDLQRRLKEFSSP
jgi:hypothetical protein